MCGIAGYWMRRPWPEYDHNRATTDLQRMVHALAHRGPDDAGAWVDQGRGVYFGHRRLAILDLSAAGHQPMSSHSGRHVISFNGEIYNFRELQRALLDEGVPIQSGSDTEVLVNAIELWGVERTLQRLIGMFAFAIWDRESRSLLLVRDRLGVKPLYYGSQGGCIWFASEPSSIVAHSKFRAEICSESLNLATRFGYIPAPYSVYERCWKLPAGCYLRIEESDMDLAPPELPLTEGPLGNGQVCYWSALARAQTPPMRRKDYAEALEELDALLSDATRLRLVSDVPLGAFLSGGTDSSLVVSYMRKFHQGKVRTFSIGFEDPTFDESPIAREVATRLGTEHTDLVVTAADALDLIPRIPQLFSEPFADSSQIPTFFVAQLARRDVTVSLSGDGGDELFGGYQRYWWANKIWRRFSAVPLSLRRAFAWTLTNTPTMILNQFGRFAGGFGMPWLDGTFGHKAHRVAGIVALPTRADVYEGFITVTRTPQQWLASRTQPEPWSSAWKGWDRGGNFTEFMMMLDSALYLPDDILVKVDRTTMAVGLEGREPLLDHRVYEFAWTLPVAWRGESRPQKRMIRDLLRRVLPDSMVDRPKKGFSIPLAEWLRGPLRDWAEDLFTARSLRESGVFDPAEVRKLWEQHLSGRRSPHALLWNILMVEAWLSDRRRTSISRHPVDEAELIRPIASASVS